MSNLIPFVVIGLVTGSSYGLAAVGLAMTYETSGIMNFGQGATAAAAAYMFYELHVADQGSGFAEAGRSSPSCLCAAAAESALNSLQSAVMPGARQRG